MLELGNGLSPDRTEQSVRITRVVDAPLAGEQHRKDRMLAHRRTAYGSRYPFFGRVVDSDKQHSGVTALTVRQVLVAGR